MGRRAPGRVGRLTGVADGAADCYSNAVLRLIALLLLGTAHAGPATPADPTPPSIGDIANTLRRENTWDITLYHDDQHSISFHFGDVGKRIIQLQWAEDDNASVGEISGRVDGIYQGGESKSVGKAGMKVRGQDGARGEQAYGEMLRTVNALNKGRLQSAENHLTMMESAAGGLADPARAQYAAAAQTLRRAQAILGGDDALKRLIRAAETGDFQKREALKAELRAFGRSAGVDMTALLEAASEIWDAYAEQAAPAAGRGDLAAALHGIDAAEAMVQGPFKRSAYTAAFERVRSLSVGLKKNERAILAERLRRHAEMWNKVAADTIAAAFLVSLSPDGKVRLQKDALVGQARWKGQQAARAHALARQLLAI